jgi:hypothetical protein
MGDIYGQNIQPDGTIGVVTTAIPIAGSLNDVGIYPNPFSDRLDVEGKVENAVIKIYNSKGNLVISSAFNSGRQEINTASLPDGIYICNIITSSGRIISEKIVKQ